MRIPYDVPVSVGRELVAIGSDIAAAILLTMEAGWALAATSPDMHAGSGEVEITERLRDGMRQALNKQRFAWRKNLIVAPGTESRSQPNVMSPDGRTDIPIYIIEIFVRIGEHDPHAIIECKRLAGSDAHLCREYVVEGIDRFRVGKYGANHTIGFMAGYLLSGDEGTAAAGVNAYLTRKARQMEHLARGVLLVRPSFWSSLHPRAIAPTPIELHHSLFTIPTSAAQADAASKAAAANCVGSPP